MLSHYSWGDYLLTVCVLTGTYYLVIGFIYFRRDMKLPFSKARLSSVHSKEKNKSPESDRSELLAEELEMVANDLRYAILEKAGKNASKPQLLDQLLSRLENYTGLRQPAYRVAISNYVIRHAKEICGVEFSAEELEEAWKTLPRN